MRRPGWQHAGRLPCVKDCRRQWAGVTKTSGGGFCPALTEPAGESCQPERLTEGLWSFLYQTNGLRHFPIRTEATFDLWALLTIPPARLRRRQSLRLRLRRSHLPLHKGGCRAGAHLMPSPSSLSSRPSPCHPASSPCHPEPEAKDLFRMPSVSAKDPSSRCSSG